MYFDQITVHVPVCKPRLSKLSPECTITIQSSGKWKVRERETKMNAGDKRRISNRWRRRGTGKASFIQFFCLFVFKRLNGAQLNS